MNQTAHWMAAQRILQALGAAASTLAWPSSQAMSEARLETPNELIPLIRKRHRLLCDAWLNRIGHLRPGMHKGPEWEEVMHQRPLSIKKSKPWFPSTHRVRSSAFH